MSDKRSVWCGDNVCEERDASGSVSQRSFSLGQQTGTTVTFFANDHIGNVVSVTSASGVALAQYAFDPWGRRTLTSGTDVTNRGFGGYDRDVESNLWLAKYRAYDSDSGRWLSSDPLGLLDGPNLYQFAQSNPINVTDADGLACSSTPRASVLILAYPLIFKNRLEKGEWQFLFAFTPVGPDMKGGLFELGTLVDCTWKRRIVSHSHWRRIYMDIFNCQDSCGRSYSERRRRVVDSTTTKVYEEAGRNLIIIPLVVDLFMDPESACMKRGQPGY